jgi:very-short-patch-repair endonuclease
MPQRSFRRRTILARKLRADSTDVERILWRALRESFPTLKFRRQHPIGRRIADFACLEKKLVIELDGSQHAVQSHEDEVRTAELASSDYRVIRFWNNNVIEHLSSVLETIQRDLETAPPHPALSAPLGRRGNMSRQ